MNVKIENAELRYKITEADLNELLRGQFLRTEAQIADQHFVVTICPIENDGGVNCRLCAEGKDTYLTLFLPTKEILTLSDMGRNRKGLAYHIGDLKVIVQVDIHEDSRKSKRS